QLAQVQATQFRLQSEARRRRGDNNSMSGQPSYGSNSQNTVFHNRNRFTSTSYVPETQQSSTENQLTSMQLNN
ncbi:MAG TPA: hypothetical protein VI522_05505, partial [Gammaproteobacteria bacterium]|nr:hypothetical protein [Gammaproteobacteria bacterium]